MYLILYCVFIFFRYGVFSREMVAVLIVNLYDGYIGELEWDNLIMTISLFVALLINIAFMFLTYIHYKNKTTVS